MKYGHDSLNWFAAGGLAPPPPPGSVARASALAATSTALVPSRPSSAAPEPQPAKAPAVDFLGDLLVCDPEEAGVVANPPPKVSSGPTNGAGADDEWDAFTGPEAVTTGTVHNLAAAAPAQASPPPAMSALDDDGFGEFAAVAVPAPEVDLFAVAPSAPAPAAPARATAKSPPQRLPLDESDFVMGFQPPAAPRQPQLAGAAVTLGVPASSQASVARAGGHTLGGDPFGSLLPSRPSGPPMTAAAIPQNAGGAGNSRLGSQPHGAAPPAADGFDPFMSAPGPAAGATAADDPFTAFVGTPMVVPPPQHLPAISAVPNSGSGGGAASALGMSPLAAGTPGSFSVASAGSCLMTRPSMAQRAGGAGITPMSPAAKPKKITDPFAGLL
jgi:hypothetical protein